MRLRRGPITEKERKSNDSEMESARIQAGDLVRAGHPLNSNPCCFALHRAFSAHILQSHVSWMAWYATSRPTTAIQAQAKGENVSNAKTVAPFAFRRSVGLCIFSRSHGNKVFAARRRDDKSGSWQLPQVGLGFRAISYLYWYRKGAGVFVDGPLQTQMVFVRGRTNSE